MIAQSEISRIAFRLQVSDRVIEKDYIITAILLALSSSKLSEALAFKGGTALKKIYFPDYRFSEDLDFTLIAETDPDTLVSEFEAILSVLAKNQGFQFQISPDRIEKRENSLTLYVNFVGPLQARLQSRNIKMDFTLSEKLVFQLEKRAIYSAYSDASPGSLSVYSLEEVLVEKLCAIIGRTEPRDIFDANFLFSEDDLDFHCIKAGFQEKAEFKRIDPSKLDELIERKKPIFASMWKNRLEHQIQDLPHFEEIIRNLRRSLREHLEY